MRNYVDAPTHCLCHPTWGLMTVKFRENIDKKPSSSGQGVKCIPDLFSTEMRFSTFSTTLF